MLTLLFNQTATQRYSLVGLRDARFSVDAFQPFAAWGDEFYTGVSYAITTAEAFGSPAANFTETGIGISSAEVFGAGKIRLTEFVQSISSAEVFGFDKDILVEAEQGIASAEAFGNPASRFIEYAAGIASVEAFGFDVDRLIEVETGIGSAEAFGNASSVFVPSVVGVESEEAFGLPSVSQSETQNIVHAAEIAVLGVVPPHIAAREHERRRKQVFQIVGIASEEAFGLPLIDPDCGYSVNEHNKWVLLLLAA